MPFPFIAAAMGASALSNIVGQAMQRRSQKRENQRIYEQTLRDQERIQAEQRQYDSPKSQMSRFIEAGLNPHLIYGGGSSSAGSAFPFEPARQQPVQEPNYLEGLAPSFISAQMADAQIGLQEAKMSESAAKTQSLQIQNEISKTNPMLNPSVAAMVSEAMLETARLKSLESQTWTTLGDARGRALLEKKVTAQVEAMSQRLGLNTMDLKIKNAILESKEFENQIKEVQAKWLKDGDLSPEHIRQGLMLILSKMMGK